jgi:photosystem II stability/assembly factor-like uncharacterized protein
MADGITEEHVAQARNLTIEQVRAIKAVRVLTEQQILDLPQDALVRAALRSQYPDLAERRQAFRAGQLADSNGPPTAESRLAALTHVHRARQQPQTAARALSAAEAELQHIGHAYMNATWTSLGPGATGGRTRCIVVHPTTPDKIWAGSAGGGVWRSIDGGASWSPVTDMMPNLAVSCLAMDPSNSDIIYAGTGEGFITGGDGIRGLGIWMGNADSWTSLPSTTTSPDFQYVNRLAVSHDGAVVLAATGTGLFRSVDPARSTWTSVITQTNVADVRFHPTDSRKAVASSMFGGVVRSADGGLTWTIATPIAPYTQIGNNRVELAYAARNPSIVYAAACTAIYDSNGDFTGWASVIWRSDNEGATFSLRGNGTAYLSTQGNYANAIWAGDPSNADFVIVGGLDLWKSIDGGVKLTRISDSTKTGSVHADHHAIVAHPSFGPNNKTVFFGNDGGLYKTADIRTAGTDPDNKSGWTCLNHGYSATQFYSAAGSATSGRIIGGAQDNGTLVYTGNAETWSLMRTGDGGVCASDPGDPNYFYGEQWGLSIFRSTDAGLTAESICGLDDLTGTWKPARYYIPDTVNHRTTFIAPFVLDPGNANRILAGGLSLWRTNDAKAPNTRTTGPSWAEIKPPILANKFITAIAIAPTDSDTVWVGYDNGEIYASSNGTATTPTWRQVFTASPSRTCTRLGFGSDTNTVYACFGGFVASNIQKTTNGGSTWTDASNGLAAAPVRAVTLHPTHFGLVFAGTETGMFVSTDGGRTWSPSRKSPNASPVDDLIWAGPRLVAATHGRGMYSIVPATPTANAVGSPSVPVQIGSDVHVFYRDENNHLSHLFTKAGRWSWEDLTAAGVPAPKGDPVGYYFQFPAYFRDANDHLVRLFYHSQFDKLTY